ncbi:MAG: proline--tRNA ligase [Bacilli bacterium]
MQDKKVKNIASKSENMAQWYTDVCTKAELMDYASAKGFIVYRPDGYALWEEIQNYLNGRFKELGVRNVYLPSLIPMSLLDKEKEHIKGFAPECAVVTRGGDKTLAEPMVVRPTSETLFCDHFKNILHSYNDLPIEYNQWCSVVRWERTTRPFLRGAEFLWQEGHTLHETENEAREFALSILRIYNDLGRDMLAVPFIMGQKPKSEKFAGAVDTYDIEGLMPDGQALQCGTSHYLGTGFPEHFGIRFLGKDNKIAYPHYTSWGVSTRLIGAVIMMHGDDNGLVLPPMIAPTQVVIVPIRFDSAPEVLAKSREIEEKLKSQGVRVFLDSSNKTPGWKFAQYEMKGVPLRIEIGPKDLEKNQVMLTRRFDNLKTEMPIEKCLEEIPTELKKIQEGMYNKALTYVNSHITECKSYDEIKEVLSKGKGFAKVMWNPENEALDNARLKADFNATPRVIPFDQKPFGTLDPISGKDDATQVVYFDRAY